MSPTLGWLLLGGAVLLLPARSAGRWTAAVHGSMRRPVGGAESAVLDRRAMSRAGGLAVASASVAIACLAAFGVRTGMLAAAITCPVTAAVVRWLQRRPARTAADRSLALVLDLAAAALRSGRPLGDALTLAAPAAEPSTAATLRRVAGLCALGADAAQAWSAVPRDGPLGEVAAVAVRSATSGIKLAGALERLATEIRADCAATAAVRAHRAGVSAMAPLAACFLPSFVCLGVIPVVVGIAKAALGTVP
jgi:Flp pilus assembly protein TadB